MAISRMQMKRQLYAGGGIMELAPRSKFGLGSSLKKFVRKVIPNEISEIAVKAAPFVAPFNPLLAGAMAGIGSFDQTGSISSGLKRGLLTYGGGQAARYLGGAGFQEGYNPLGGLGEGAYSLGGFQLGASPIGTETGIGKILSDRAAAASQAANASTIVPPGAGDPAQFLTEGAMTSFEQLPTPTTYSGLLKQVVSPEATLGQRTEAIKQLGGKALKAVYTDKDGNLDKLAVASTIAGASSYLDAKRLAKEADLVADEDEYTKEMYEADKARYTEKYAEILPASAFGLKKGGRVGYAEGSNLYGGYSGNKISQVEDPLGLIQRLNKAGGNRTPYDNISYLPSEGGYVEWDGSSWTVTSPEMIEQRIKDWESVNYSPIQPPNTLDTPTEGSVSQEGVIPGFTKLINPDGATGNYNEFMYEGPDDQIYGAETYSSIAAGQYPNIYDPSKNTATEQTTPTVAEQMISPDDAMNQYDISNQVDEVTGVGSGALTAGSLLPKYIDDFQYAAPPGTDIDQLRNLARQTASDKSITDLLKDVYNDPDKFDPDFKRGSQIKASYPQYVKEGILSAIGFQPTSQIGGGTNAGRALLEKIGSIPGAKTLGRALPGVGTASGVYDVGSRLSQGDYFGAGLGALSAIPFVGIPAAAAQAAYDYRGPLIEKATNFFNKLQSAPSNVTEHINTAVGSLNPFQQQQYVNYAIQNPDQAITAAQQNKDFLAATQKNIAPAPASMAAGGRVGYQEGGTDTVINADDLDLFQEGSPKYYSPEGEEISFAEFEEAMKEPIMPRRKPEEMVEKNKLEKLLKLRDNMEPEAFEMYLEKLKEESGDSGIPSIMLKKKMAIGGRVGFFEGTDDPQGRRKGIVSINPMQEDLEEVGIGTMAASPFTAAEKTFLFKFLAGKGGKERTITMPDLYKIFKNPGKYPKDEQVLKGVIEMKMGKKEGGRIGFMMGSEVPVRENQAGVREMDFRKTGGFVPPIGVKEKADDIPAMLSNNEFVFTADAVRAAGGGSVNKGAQKMYALMKQLEGKLV
jgi:hypothetical protein